MHSTRLVFLAILLASTKSGCIPPDEVLGGTIVANVRVTGTSASGEATAQFYLDVDGELPAANPWEGMPLESCRSLEAIPTPDYKITGRDVGDSIQLRSGSKRIALLRSLDAGLPYYHAQDISPDDLTPGASYDVQLVLHGSGEVLVWSQSIDLPRVPELTEPTPSLGAVSFPGDRPLRVRFSELQAQDVYIVFTDRSGDGVVCHVPDDGEFEVPIWVINALPVSGWLQIIGIDANFEELEGDLVELSGQVVVEVPYERS